MLPAAGGAPGPARRHRLKGVLSPAGVRLLITIAIMLTSHCSLIDIVLTSCCHQVANNRQIMLISHLPCGITWTSRCSLLATVPPCCQHVAITLPAHRHRTAPSLLARCHHVAIVLPSHCHHVVITVPPCCHRCVIRVPSCCQTCCPHVAKSLPPTPIAICLRVVFALPSH